MSIVFSERQSVNNWSQCFFQFEKCTWPKNTMRQVALFVSSIPHVTDNFCSHSFTFENGKKLFFVFFQLWQLFKCHIRIFQYIFSTRMVNKTIISPTVENLFSHYIKCIEENYGIFVSTRIRVKTNRIFLLGETTWRIERNLVVKRLQMSRWNNLECRIRGKNSSLAQQMHDCFPKTIPWFIITKFIFSVKPETLTNQKNVSKLNWIR